MDIFFDFLEFRQPATWQGQIKFFTSYNFKQNPLLTSLHFYNIYNSYLKNVLSLKYTSSKLTHSPAKYLSPYQSGPGLVRSKSPHSDCFSQATAKLSLQKFILWKVRPVYSPGFSFHIYISKPQQACECFHIIFAIRLFAIFKMNIIIEIRNQEFTYF